MYNAKVKNGVAREKAEEKNGSAVEGYRQNRVIIPQKLNGGVAV